jgi:predicted PurR-regulated permease PerM
MAILSIIPGIGAALIWVPAIGIKLSTGSIYAGIGILVGGLIISVSDNILRPALVGRDTKMHELMILFSTLGGIALFGIIGFILGPILTAVFLTVLDIYGSEYREQLEHFPRTQQQRFPQRRSKKPRKPKTAKTNQNNRPGKSPNNSTQRKRTPPKDSGT